jgi:TRAP-type C4-dicarboxylate transport system permease small subunit
VSAPLQGVPLGRVPPALAPLAALIHRLNAWLAAASGVAIGIAACVLTWEATARYLFKIPSDWQDEVSIFLLVGATFLAAGWVQEARGHVGIQALAGVLPPRADAVRRYLSDILAFLFCGFFAWKSWTLLAEAVHDGQTSNSALGAPLWIPYGAMALGSTMLALQLLLQVLARQSLQTQPEPH